MYHLSYDKITMKTPSCLVPLLFVLSLFAVHGLAVYDSRTAQNAMTARSILMRRAAVQEGKGCVSPIPYLSLPSTTDRAPRTSPAPASARRT